jgi:hypothetical protein
MPQGIFLFSIDLPLKKKKDASPEAFLLTKIHLAEQGLTHAHPSHANPSAGFLVMPFAPTHTGTWPLPHLHAHEPKQHPRALPTHRQKTTPIKPAPS